MDTLFFTHAPLYSGCLPPENTPQAVLAVYTASASERDSQANPHSVTLHQKRPAGCCRGGRFPTPVHLGAIHQAGHHAVVLHNWASFVERRASVCACKPSLLQTQAELREPGGQCGDWGAPHWVPTSIPQVPGCAGRPLQVHSWPLNQRCRWLRRSLALSPHLHPSGARVCRAAPISPLLAPEPQRCRWLRRSLVSQSAKVYSESTGCHPAGEPSWTEADPLPVRLELTVWLQKPALVKAWNRRTQMHIHSEGGTWCREGAHERESRPFRESRGASSGSQGLTRGGEQEQHPALGKNSRAKGEAWRNSDSEYYLPHAYWFH